LDDNLHVSNTADQKEHMISERKLRFSVPSDTFYRVRGSQTQRIIKGYIPYPIAVANVAYPKDASALFPDPTVRILEPKAPPRSAKSVGSTPRSSVILSKTVFIPAPLYASESPRTSVSQVSQLSSKAKDHIVTAEMQMKGILFEAGAVSATMFKPNFVNAAPLYSGSGPKVKTTTISDKVWSRTAKVAAAADK
jgi:hypothetical protein